jgi:hypothetical protein
MNKKYYESSKVLNSYIDERKRLKDEYGDKPLRRIDIANYAIAITADLVNTFLAFMILLDGAMWASAGLAAIFAYMIGWWVPHEAGALLKDGVVRNSTLLKRNAFILIFIAGMAIAGITVIRLLNLESTGSALGSLGLGGDASLSVATGALALVLTCVMLLTFTISLTSTYGKRNYFRTLYLSKALAALDEEERNSTLHATEAEMMDEDNAPELIIEEVEAQKNSVLDQIDKLAALFKEHARDELEIWLANPDKTTIILNAESNKGGM